ncbi:nuclear localization sequence-binding protein-like [Argonauta hians]
MAKTNEMSTRSQTNKWKNEKSKVRRSKRTIEIAIQIRNQSSSGFQSKLLLSEKRTSPRHKTPITKTTKTKTPQKTPKTAAAAKTPSSSSSPTVTTPTTKVGSANNSSNSSSSKSSSKKNKDKKVKTPPKSKTPPVTAKSSKANTSVTPTNTTSNKNSCAAAATTNNSAGADKSFSMENKPVKKAYVVFVGNLPYSVTKEQLEEHFRKTGGVKKVRIPTERGTNKPRGFAYIEFKDRISHKIGLRMHHTHLNGRQINVEFTSIGGNNPRRREKLQQKNSKLSKMKRDYTRPESSWK